MTSVLPVPTPVEPLPVEPEVAQPGPPLRKGRPSPPRRWMLWIALALVAGSAAYVVAKRARTRAPAGATGAIPTARVGRGDLRRTLRVSGAIGAKEFATIVAPRIMRGGGGGDGGGSQMILIKLIKPGTPVNKGDVIAEFDRQWQLQRIDDQHADVVQADSAITKRKAELDIVMEGAQQSLRAAKADHEKAKLDLKTAEIRSAIDAEKLKLAVEETEARYRQLEAERKLMQASHQAEIRGLEIKRDRANIDKIRAQANAEKMVMRAPINGIAVSQMTFRGGQFGQVQQGDQLFPGSSFLQIVNPAAMVLNAAANQAESQDVRLGQRAEVRLDAYPGEVWPGRIFSMGAMASSSVFGMRGGSRALYVKQIPVRVLIEAKDPRILPDLSASASVILQEEKNVLLVPLAAVERESGKDHVRVRTSRGWERRQVQLGLTNQTHAVVQAGLNADDEVALALPAPENAPSR